MAPLEAMSYRIPCLISKNCNLPEAIKKGAAIETNPSVDELVESLKILFKMEPDKRNTMSDLAYKYILENHSWSKLTSEIKIYIIQYVKIFRLIYFFYFLSL